MTNESYYLELSLELAEQLSLTTQALNKALEELVENEFDSIKHVEDGVIVSAKEYNHCVNTLIKTCKHVTFLSDLIKLQRDYKELTSL